MIFSYLYQGIHIINLKKTWEKIVLAARIIAGIENPADVCVISARPYGTVSIEHLFLYNHILDYSSEWGPMQLPLSVVGPSVG